jgi:predicted proteasome-type protease
VTARGEPVPARSTARRLVPLSTDGLVLLSPNVLAVKHWERLLGGALYAATARVDWASLLRRSFDGMRHFPPEARRQSRRRSIPVAA